MIKVIDYWDIDHSESVSKDNLESIASNSAKEPVDKG